MMVARTIIAQYVKEMRKKYKLTQVDLSEKAGVDYFEGHLCMVASMGTTWQEQVVGYLHDASEDTPIYSRRGSFFT